MSEFKFIDCNQAADKLKEENYLVVDIRDKDSYNQGHIEGAVNLTNDNIEDFVIDTAKDKSIIVCCYHGNSSQRAAQFLVNNGFYHFNPGVVCDNGWHTKISNIEKNFETKWLSSQACIYKTQYIKNIRFGSNRI